MAATTDASCCCASCGASEADLAIPLLRCTKCKVVKYCGKDCQKAHWKAHKHRCKISANMNANPEAVRELMSMGRNKPVDPIDEARKKQLKETAKNLREMGRSDVPVMCVSHTKYGPVMPGMPLPKGVPENFALKQNAVLEYQKGPASAGSGKRGNMKGELAYKRYFDGIAKDEESRAAWLNFLSEAEHKEHAEHTVGILGTLATIYRQRGALEECEEVLNVQDDIFTSYKKSIEGETQFFGKLETEKSVWCYDTLQMKSNNIRFNLFLQTGRYEECVRLYRSLLDYELKYDIPFEDQQFLFMVPTVLKKSPTRRVLDSLTDDELLQLVMMPVKMEGGVNARLNVERKKQKVAVESCANCSKAEEAMRQFKSCPRCGSVYYCGRDCQKKHWKKHKKVCRNR